MKRRLINDSCNGINIGHFIYSTLDIPTFRSNMTNNNTSLTKTYPFRYVNQRTGEILNKSTYTDNGVLKYATNHYLFEGKWVPPGEIPVYREECQKRHSSLKGFFKNIKAQMVYKNKKFESQGRVLIGDNEFQDGFNCYDKLQAHYDEQVARWGPVCPITLRKFTFERLNAKTGKGNSTRIISNLSHDRLLNPNNYTKQNMLFTSAGWNLQRLDFSFRDMKQLMPKPFFIRYREILFERFPDRKYEFTELENGAEHPQERR